MTARRQLKRLVRARMAKTGEPYAKALAVLRSRLEERPTMNEETRRIDKPDQGFAMEVPLSWRDLPPDKTNSYAEVGRFLSDDDSKGRGCLVFHTKVTGSRTPRDVAEQTINALSRSYEDFSVTDTVLHGEPAAVLTCRSKTGGDGRALRYFFTVTDRDVWVLSFGSSQPDQDRALFDALAATFRRLPVQAAQETPSAPKWAERVVYCSGLAAGIARQRGRQATSPEDLLLAFLTEGQGVAAVALLEEGVDLEALESQVRDLAPAASDDPTDASVTPDLDELLNRRAPDVAASYGHDFIGTETVLLAMLDHESIARSALQALVPDTEVLRRRVEAIWSGNGLP